MSVMHCRTRRKFVASARKTKSPDSNDVAVGLRIRMYRLSRRLPQKTLAYELGVTTQQLSKYELGINRIGAGRLQKIAEILDIPITALFDARNDEAAALTADLSFISHGGMRLMRAYAAIGNPNRREALIQLAEEMAGQGSEKVMGSD